MALATPCAAEIEPAASESAMTRWPRSPARRRRAVPSIFLLCIVDHDNGRFTLEGPMIDAEAWIREVIAARRAGRDITCRVMSGSPDEAAEDWTRVHGGARWPSGSIVAPESFETTLDAPRLAEPADLPA